MEILFSYGTLQKSDTQLKLFGRLLKGTKDILQRFSLSPIEITDPAFLASGEQKDQSTLIATGNENDGVDGMALEVTSSELLLADQYEPIGYERTEVMLQSGKKAWIYTSSADQRIAF